MPFQMPEIRQSNALAMISNIRQQRTQNALAERQIALTEGAQRRQDAEFQAQQQAEAQERQRTALADVFNAVEQAKTPERAMQIGASIMQTPEWQSRFGQGGDVLAQRMLSTPEAWAPENIRTAASAYGIRLRSQELQDMAAEARVKRAPAKPDRRLIRDQNQNYIALDMDTLEGTPTGYTGPTPPPTQMQPTALTIIPGVVDENGIPVAYDTRTNTAVRVGTGTRPTPGAPPPTMRRPAAPVPAAVTAAIRQNDATIRSLEAAIGLLEGKTVDGIKGDSSATGPLNAITPNFVLDYVDEEGVATRAAVADVGSLVIHDRSGAAVTAAEFPRLAPFIPTANDRPGVARLKLQRMLAMARQEAEAYRAAYGGQGQPAAPTGAGTSAAPATGPTRITNDAQFNALPRGALFIGPDGQTRRKP